MNFDQSHPIFPMSDAFADRYAALVPIDATYDGIGGHDAEWGDLSAPGGDQIREELTAFNREVAAMPEPPDRWAALARRVALDWSQRGIDDYEPDEYLRELRSIASTFQHLRDVLDLADTTTAQGWSDLASRLEGLETAATQYRSRLDEGRRRGLTTACRQAAAVAEQAAVHAGPDSFFRTLPGAFAAAGIADSALEARIERGSTEAIRVMAEMQAYFTDVYLPDAVEADAVGEERYLRASRGFLGMDLDARETYAWGWHEVATLRADMERLAGQIEPGATLAGAMVVLKTDPARAAGTRDDFLRLMRARQQQALADLTGSHFDVPPEIRSLDVKIAPPGGPLGAYYNGPTEDFTRPGSVWYSLGSDQVIPLYDQVSTAYHEGFPGHHLQVGVQVALTDRLSRIHRMLAWMSGYGEGWALYAEQLMYELGYLEQPDYVMGLRAAQMLRACRVVIDIGSHLRLPIPQGQQFHPGEEWTFETAVEMLGEYATLDDDYARSEVARYLGWPGQAISYKVGERVILDLREELRQRRGADFDLKEFHGAVLSSGPVGLDLLRQLVLG